MSLALAEHAPAFSLPGVDGGTPLARRATRDAEVLVLIQSCNHCPYVIAWEGRMIAIQRDYADRGVRVVAFNSNDASRYPDDSFERDGRRAQSSEGFNFDYLHDPDQSLARALGARADARGRSSSTATVGSSTTARSTTAATRRAVTQPLPPRRARRGARGGAPADRRDAPVGCTVKWRELTAVAVGPGDSGNGRSPISLSRE